MGAPADPLAAVARLAKPDGGTVYLLGTSHCSHHSAAHAAALVRALSPSAVVVELCESRRHMLRPHASLPPPPPHEEPSHSASSVLSSLSSLLADWTEVISLQYAGIERLSANGTTANEFRAAAAEATRLGAAVVLADRSCELTQRRLRTLVPTSEVVWSMLWEDGAFARDQAYRRMERAHRAQAVSAELLDAADRVARGESAAADDCVRLSRTLHELSEVAVEDTASEYADAVLGELLRRFWCYELIGEPERARLREALDGLHRVDVTCLPLSPTLRKVLLDERDAVLTEKIRTTPGARVVAVVGKAHVRGICDLWDKDTSALCASALEEPRSPVAPRVAAAAMVLSLPLAAYKYRAVRVGLGVSVGAVLVGGAWFTLALRDRLRFFEESQNRVR